ncbi:MAG TPA: response regulator [Thermodesulfobacteriota bacterium]|nr:response regulator [Thermodesulfobacteriota bacterium]
MMGVADHTEAFVGRAVLLVDDESIVVDVIREVMAPKVSVFESASNGIEALARIKDRDFDFILMDIEMPRMNGIELFRYISEMKPHLAQRVIFITGDTETEATRNFIRATGCLFLDKPFMLKDLFSVMSMLDTGP